MPLFDYKCPRCGTAREYLEWKASATYTRLCPRCDAPMERQPPAPNFTVAGFNAKNGYSGGHA